MLMTPKLYDYGDFGCYVLILSKVILQEDERHPDGWRMYDTTCGITSKAKGNYRQVNLQINRFDHSEVWRGYGVDLCNNLKVLV